MKSYTEFLEESKKKSKEKKAKRKPTVEIMPVIRDGEKGKDSMVTRPDNNSATGS
tara:strand:+ start:5058 stop:5222 length:165 start_codon:yes stop_codon:yes gene_type:complete